MSIPESITDLETKLLSTKSDVARIPLLLALSRKLANRDDRRAFSLAEEPITCKFGATDKPPKPSRHWHKR